MTDRQRRSIRRYRWTWLMLALACVPLAVFRHLQVMAFPSRMAAYRSALTAYISSGSAAQKKFFDARLGASVTTAVRMGIPLRRGRPNPGATPVPVGPVSPDALDVAMLSEFPNVERRGPLPTSDVPRPQWHVTYLDATSETEFRGDFDLDEAVKRKRGPVSAEAPPPLLLTRFSTRRTAPPPLSPTRPLEAFETFATDAWLAAALAGFALIFTAAYRAEGREAAAWAALAFAVAVVAFLSCGRDPLAHSAFLAASVAVVLIACLLWNFPESVAPLLYRPIDRLAGEVSHLCVRCGYDLSGNGSGTCPECGTPSGRLAPDRVAEFVRSTARLTAADHARRVTSSAPRAF